MIIPEGTEEVPNVSNGPGVTILKRNNTRFYEQILHLNTTELPDAVATNGKWFGYAQSGQTVVFKLDSSNEAIEMATIEDMGPVIKFLGDDSLIIISTSSIRSYQFNGTEWTLITETITEINIQFPSYAAHFFDDDHLALFSSPQTALFLTRSTNNSWSVVDSLETNSTSALTSIAWNGNDTVMLGAVQNSFGLESGVLSIYTKDQLNEWKLQRTINASELTTGVAYFTLSLQAADANTFYVGAPLDGFFQTAISGGSVFIFTRNMNLLWEPTVRISSTAINVLFGTDILITDQEIVFGSIAQGGDGLVTYLHSLPMCYFDPINVTCSDTIMESCDTLTDIEIPQLYMDNTPQCGAALIQQDQLSLGFNGSVIIHLEFQRNANNKASCDVLITCRTPSTPNQVTVPTTNAPGTTSGSLHSYHYMSLGSILVMAIALLH